MIKKIVGLFICTLMIITVVVPAFRNVNKIENNPNQPPLAPTITGPHVFAPNKDKEFTFTTTDPDGDQICYYVDWGDGNINDYQGYYESGYVLTLSHSWNDHSRYTIICKAIDTNGLESPNGTLDISVPRIMFWVYFQHMFPRLWEFLGL
jgi:hypothetical protein